jgi:hypothetical protein
MYDIEYNKTSFSTGRSKLNIINDDWCVRFKKPNVSEKVHVNVAEYTEVDV